MYKMRQLKAADRSSFRELRQLALTVNPDDFMLTTAEEEAIPRLSIEDAIEQPDDRNFFLGAFADTSPTLAGVVGLVTSRLVKIRHAGHITSLFVQPDRRRAGIARMLLQRLMSRAATAGLESVRLEVVASNRSAIALYESLGFVKYGCEPAAYRMEQRAWDLLLMTRNL